MKRFVEIWAYRYQASMGRISMTSLITFVYHGHIRSLLNYHPYDLLPKKTVIGC